MLSEEELRDIIKTRVTYNTCEQLQTIGDNLKKELADLNHQEKLAVKAELTALGEHPYAEFEERRAKRRKITEKIDKVITKMYINERAQQVKKCKI